MLPHAWPPIISANQRTYLYILIYASIRGFPGSPTSKNLGKTLKYHLLCPICENLGNWWYPHFEDTGLLIDRHNGGIFSYSLRVLSIAYRIDNLINIHANGIGYEELSITCELSWWALAFPSAQTIVRGPIGIHCFLVNSPIGVDHFFMRTPIAPELAPPVATELPSPIGSTLSGQDSATLAELRGATRDIARVTLRDLSPV